jgi:hypothetical protein
MQQQQEQQAVKTVGRVAGYGCRVVVCVCVLLLASLFSPLLFFFLSSQNLKSYDAL